MRSRDLPLAIWRCGFLGATVLFTARRKLRRLLPEQASVRIKGIKFPIRFRRVSTDRYVIAEVLLRDQYACLRGRAGVRAIVDAGANIGTASVDFMNQYPEARVVALEPDPGNYDLLAQNLRPYGPRAIALRRALWHTSEHLSVVRGEFRDGGEWSVQVKPVTGTSSSQGLPDVAGTSLPDLLDEFQIDRVDILKIDIEGAERLLLPEPLGTMLDRVGILAIELHDAECHERFRRMVEEHPGRVERHGEVATWTAADSASDFSPAVPSPGRRSSGT